ncbi:hypothetical protein J8273_1919 [Carpediemonas membranifera]|uniref:Uncharacterized protein n=1 Tax=Carpediemonas membranifera TaxID=201153 RepID=A0A8J6BBL1_9EUKA|nr:hypothetical protein J8273_1919 [Carpediemonas membranifera]|eukprot:KAG9396872.1 hypothetical protein J8273_1919 [Carpediemonas membranifera]
MHKYKTIEKGQNVKRISRFKTMTRAHDIDSIHERLAFRTDLILFVLNSLYGLYLLALQVATIAISTLFPRHLIEMELLFFVSCIPIGVIAVLDAFSVLTKGMHNLYIAPSYGLMIRGIPTLTLLVLGTIVALAPTTQSLVNTSIGNIQAVGVPEYIISFVVASQIFTTLAYLPLFVTVSDMRDANVIRRALAIVWRVLAVHRFHQAIGAKTKAFLHLVDTVVLFTVTQIPTGLLFHVVAFIRHTMTHEKFEDDSIPESIVHMAVEFLLGDAGHAIKLVVRTYFVLVASLLVFISMPIHFANLRKHAVAGSTGQSAPHDRPHTLHDIVLYLVGWWREIAHLLRFVFNVEEKVRESAVFEI